MNALVLVDAELDDRTGVAVRVEGGRIVALGRTADVDRLGAEVLDARGGALLPGLHDHHLHLLALAARLASVDLEGAATPSEADAALAAAARTASLEPGRWVRAVGHDEHRHGPLDRHRLDALVGAVPARVQHRSGLTWVVSTAGLRALGLDPGPGPGAAEGDPVPDPAPGREPAGADRGPGPADAGAGAAVERGSDGAATGRLHRLDRWLGERVGRTAPDLAAAGAHLAALGITGVTDATVALDDGALDLLLAGRRRGALPQRLVVLGSGRADLPRLVVGASPVATAADPAPRQEPLAWLGPWKLVADEHVGLDVDALTAAVARAHGEGRAVAIHCVTRAECVAAVAALEGAGPRPGDRLEHGSTLPADLDGVLARHRVTVVAQPAWVAERGDHYLEAVEPDDRPILHRLASLRAAGVPLASGSDAPAGTADPWVALRAAVERRSRAGRIVGAGEALAPGEALALFLGAAGDPGGPARRVEVGAPADLCLLDRPRAEALAAPTADAVAATVVGGSIVHRAPRP